MTGNLTVAGTITGATVAATSNLTVASKEMGGHTHAENGTGGGETDAPT